MRRLRNSTLRLISLKKVVSSVDRRYTKAQLTITAIVVCILLVLTQVKPVINEQLDKIYQLIEAIEKTGSPGAAKAIPCASHPGKNCAAGVFGNAIAQMHGCCGSVSSVGTTSDSNFGQLKVRP